MISHPGLYSPTHSIAQKGVCPKPPTTSVEPVSKVVKTAGGNTSKTSTGADDSLPLIKVKAKSVTVMHHGLKKHKALPKGRHCVCDMCGSNFTNSTSFITHYSETHPLLPCKDCSKIFSNPLSLQKHRYHHTGQQLMCGKCNRTLLLTLNYETIGEHTLKASHTDAASQIVTLKPLICMT